MSDKTLRELQTQLPWTGHYHRDFRSTPMTHKDFGHALLHVHKAGGKLAGIINDAEHGGVDWADPKIRAEVEKYMADLVICALRMATTCPDGQIDLQTAVERRLFEKNNQLATDATKLRTVERMGGAITTVQLSKEQSEQLMKGVSQVSVGYSVDPPQPQYYEVSYDKDKKKEVVSSFEEAMSWFARHTGRVCESRSAVDGWIVFPNELSGTPIGLIKPLKDRLPEGKR